MPNYALRRNPTKTLISIRHKMSARRALLWVHILIIFNGIVLSLSLEQTLNVNAKVRSWGDKQLFPPQKIPENALSPSRSAVRRKILLYHNFFRMKVKPSASNMLLMSWHPGAARQAQTYADKCIFLQHNPARENTVPQLGQCGQNLFASAQKTPWFFAIKSWFLEYRNFTFGSPGYNLHDVGHYTQMIWATSHKVGCGIAHCRGGPWGHFYNYVCHYCPGGNILPGIEFPYKPGTPCSDCPNHCVSGYLCTNSCNKKDLYSNCDELISYPEVCVSGHCNATCQCDTKLHKNYPWR